MKQLIGGVAAAVGTSNAAFAEQDVALTCTYKRSASDKGVVEATTGEAWFLLLINDAGVVPATSSKCRACGVMKSVGMPEPPGTV